MFWRYSWRLAIMQSCVFLYTDEREHVNMILASSSLMQDSTSANARLLAFTRQVLLPIQIALLGHGHTLPNSGMQERRATGSSRAAGVCLAFHAFAGSGLRGDAPRDRAWKYAARAPERNSDLHHRKWRDAGARRDQRPAPYRRSEGPYSEHVPDADEPAREYRSRVHAFFLRPSANSPLTIFLDFELHLRADIAGVKRACDGGICRAFEDGTTIGENSHFIGSDTEAQ